MATPADALEAGLGAAGRGGRGGPAGRAGGARWATHRARRASAQAGRLVPWRAPGGRSAAVLGRVSLVHVICRSRLVLLACAECKKNGRGPDPPRGSISRSFPNAAAGRLTSARSLTIVRVGSSGPEAYTLSQLHVPIRFRAPARGPARTQRHWLTKTRRSWSAHDQLLHRQKVWSAQRK